MKNRRYSSNQDIREMYTQAKEPTTAAGTARKPTERRSTSSSRSSQEEEIVKIPIRRQQTMEDLTKSAKAQIGIQI